MRQSWIACWKILCRQTKTRKMLKCGDIVFSYWWSFCFFVRHSYVRLSVAVFFSFYNLSIIDADFLVKLYMYIVLENILVRIVNGQIWIFSDKTIAICFSEFKRFWWNFKEMICETLISCCRQNVVHPTLALCTCLQSWKIYIN